MPASTNVFDALQHEAISEVIAAFMIQGNRSADLVGTFLREHLFVGSNKTPSLPKWFLLDLGYALQIREWERQNLIDLLPCSLPRSTSVIQAIIQKLRTKADNPRSKIKPDQLLAHQVTKTFLLHFCHFQEKEFHGDFVVKPADRTELIETVAQWLWKHRQPTIH